MLIKKLALHVENAGLFDKALAVQAKNEKQSVDEARQSDILKAILLLPALLGNEAPARALGAALAKFIAAPKNFSLQALAPEGRRRRRSRVRADARRLAEKDRGYRRREPIGAAVEGAFRKSKDRAGSRSILAFSESAFDGASPAIGSRRR